MPNENSIIVDPNPPASVMPVAPVDPPDCIDDADLPAINLWTNQTCSTRNFIQTRLPQEISDFQQHSTRFTGYANMDTVQPLYPGLYVIGAVPSLGKTTFIYQMARATSFS